MISFGLSVCSRQMLKYKFHDINCGFRVVTARVAKSFETVTPVNYFGPELWVHAVLHGYKVDEVVTEHFERKGGASIHKPWRNAAYDEEGFRLCELDAHAAKSRAVRKPG